jgi:hypothetical protein
VGEEGEGCCWVEEEVPLGVDVDVLALAKLAVLECAGVSEVIVGGSASVDVAASSSGWAAAYAASTLSTHLPS